jgi:uncharacterized coiled-coil DUF342 family protein
MNLKDLKNELTKIKEKHEELESDFIDLDSEIDDLGYQIHKKQRELERIEKLIFDLEDELKSYRESEKEKLVNDDYIPNPNQLKLF